MNATGTPPLPAASPTGRDRTDGQGSARDAGAHAAA